MSYPIYTLNFVDTNHPTVKPKLVNMTGGPVTPDTFEAIAAVARQAVKDGAVSAIKGSHTFAFLTRKGEATAYLSHNDESHDQEPTINIVIL